MEEYQAVKLIIEEYDNAIVKFPKFNSTHEGYAILLEELDELWDLVKKNKGPCDMSEEAKQVAAMALRFLIDCC